MRIKAYTGYFKDDRFREIARIDLGKYKEQGYVRDYYLYPIGIAVVLHDEHQNSIIEDRLGNTLKAVKVDSILSAMQDDNDESETTEYDWEMDALEDERVTHVVLAVW